MKVRESQEIRVKVQRSLKEAEAQSFELYHPHTRRSGRRRSCIRPCGSSGRLLANKLIGPANSRALSGRRGGTRWAAIEEQILAPTGRLTLQGGHAGPAVR